MELVAAVLLATLVWRRVGMARWPFLVSFVSLLVSEIVIWPIRVLPTNQTVDAYTGAMPMPDWKTLRAAWEGGHLAWSVSLTIGLAAGLWAAVRQLSPPALTSRCSTGRPDLLEQVRRRDRCGAKCGSDRTSAVWRQLAWSRSHAMWS